jgi:SNF2 family DNA or RNA helicase
LDECQAIKNMDAKTTKTIIPVVIRSDIRWFASGTPIKNNYGEFYSLARMIIPMRTLAEYNLNSYAKWTSQFCIRVTNKIRVKGGLFREVTSIQGSCNPDLLKEVLGPYMLRRRKRDVLKDFPEMAWQPLYVELKEDFHYDEDVIEEALRLAKLGINPPKGHHQTLRLELSVAKVPHVVKAVQEHFESTKAPLVIFSFFLEPLAILAANLKKLKITCAGISGETSADNRFKYVEDFQAGNLQVLLGQTITAGVAITLTKAWRCIFLDLCWSPTDNQQARDRLHRIGQERDVLAQYVVVEGNPLDERVQEVLARKTRDLDQLETT